MLVTRYVVLGTMCLLAATAFSAVVYSQETPQPAAQEDAAAARVKIPVRVEHVSGNTVRVKLSDLKPDAQTAGLGDMVLEANMRKEKLPNGDDKVVLVWSTARKGEKQTYVDEAFMSQIAVGGAGLSNGDKFTAEGSAADLLAAWQRLNEVEEEKKEEEKTAQNEIEAKGASSNTGGGSSAPAGDPFQAPEFAVRENPVVTETTDGCSVRVDIDQMVAIQQKRVLEDGKEVSPCADTLDRYPLEKKYAGCPLSFEPENLRAYEQFTLSYADPISAGEIQVQSCAPDTDRVIQMTQDSSGCGIRHDFPNDISYQQARIVYMHQGVQQQYQACEDTPTTYDHTQTSDGCSVVGPVNGQVTFQYRSKINVDGVEQYISECTPDPNSTVAVQEEVCASPRYTHDFEGNQSFLNKTYWYTNQNNQRVDISTCQPSEVAYQHQLDETQCSATHDDVNKETTLRGRRFIKESAEGQNIYIASCEDIFPKVPYVQNGNQWKVTPRFVEKLKANEFDAEQLTFTCKSGPQHYCASGINLPMTNEQLNEMGWTQTKGSNGNAYMQSTVENIRIYLTARPGIKISSRMQRWCLDGKLTAPYYTADDVEINHALSNWSNKVYEKTAFVTGESGFSLPARPASGLWHLNPTGGGGAGVAYPVVNLACELPSCQVTRLDAKPVYLRGDGSSWVDEAVTTQQHYICGNGAEYENQPVE